MNEYSPPSPMVALSQLRVSDLSASQRKIRVPRRKVGGRAAVEIGAAEDTRHGLLIRR